LRLTRQNLEPVSPPDYRFQLGRWLTLRPGRDVTVIASGGTVFNALEAAKALESDGISVEVINAASIKPLDEDLLVRSASRTRHVVTVEDHRFTAAWAARWPKPSARRSHAAQAPRRDRIRRVRRPQGLYASMASTAGIAASVRKFLGR
jgi:pyruvate/2-oxoglutarate/acetoin dehydrogenase E1 component